MANISTLLWPAYRKYLQLRLQARAKASGKVFACQALHGNSGYNISIHSDLTVSCNCQDFDGSGQIGDLKNQTLREIFDGGVVQGFRDKLLAREFPLELCCTCPELILVEQSRSDEYRHHYRLPHKGIMVENTVLCNYSCRLCKRKELLKVRKQRTLPPGGIEKVADLLKEHGIAVAFFYNLGEPFLSPNVVKELEVLRETNPQLRIVTSTNGVLLDSPEKMRAALLADHILFSIDGTTQESVTRYQVGGDFGKAYRNMKRLVQLRDEVGGATTIEWRYVLFRGNDGPRQIEEAIRLSEEAGVDIISFIPGTAEFYNRTYLYRFHPFYKKLGTPCRLWEGREIDRRAGKTVRSWAVQDLED
jgi:uncharacterized Fe-S cluster-containing radical SAM superfamily protein